jgi:hypothetical protein
MCRIEEQASRVLSPDALRTIYKLHYRRFWKDACAPYAGLWMKFQGITGESTEQLRIRREIPFEQKFVLLVNGREMRVNGVMSVATFDHILAAISSRAPRGFHAFEADLVVNRRIVRQYSNKRPIVDPRSSRFWEQERKFPMLPTLKKALVDFFKAHDVEMSTPILAFSRIY